MSRVKKVLFLPAKVKIEKKPEKVKNDLFFGIVSIYMMKNFFTGQLSWFRVEFFFRVLNIQNRHKKAQLEAQFKRSSILSNKCFNLCFD
jgi:hypothetical protein